MTVPAPNGKFLVLVLFPLKCFNARPRYQLKQPSQLWISSLKLRLVAVPNMSVRIVATEIFQSVTMNHRNNCCCDNELVRSHRHVFTGNTRVGCQIQWIIYNNFPVCLFQRLMQLALLADGSMPGGGGAKPLIYCVSPQHNYF